MPLKRKLVTIVARARLWVRRHVPPGLRWVVGLVLIGLGFLGFLPVLGFWMIPLGIAVVAMDVKLLWRRFDLRHGINHHD